MLFCTNCGLPVSGGNFCGNCGHPLSGAPTSTPSSPVPAGQGSDGAGAETAGTWGELETVINRGWGLYLDLNHDLFSHLSLTEWKNLQTLLQQRASHFLGLRTLDDYRYWFAQSDEVPFTALDTIESIDVALDDFINSLDPEQNINTLLAAVGTRAQLPYGAPTSGESLYWPDAQTNIESELVLLDEVLRIGYDDNLMRDSLDPHLEAFDLLSDFGRSYLVGFLGESPGQLALLRKWGPQKTGMSLDMTSVLVAGLHAARLQMSHNMLLNPRMIHLLVDPDNDSLPWWMEMSLWYSCAEMWKEKSQFDLGGSELDVLGDYLENFLETGKSMGGVETYFQDEELFRGLLGTLRT